MPYSGSFFGNGYIISEFTLLGNETQTFGGLFGKSIGHISNLHLRELNVDVPIASGGSGGLMGQNAGLISRCSVVGNVTGQGVGTSDSGGLVGQNTGTILRSYFSGNLLNTCSNSGGLVGSSSGTIQFSFASGGTVQSADIACINRGGLVGSVSHPGSVEKSFASMQVVVEDGQNTDNIGGLIGSNTVAVLGGVAPDSVYNSDLTSLGGNQGIGINGLARTNVEMHLPQTYQNLNWSQNIWRLPTLTQNNLPELKLFMRGNLAPQAVMLSNKTIPEDAVALTLVGELSALDSESVSFSIPNNANGRFGLIDNTLHYTGVGSLILGQKYLITIQASDGLDVTSKQFQILVTDPLNEVNEAPHTILINGTALTNQLRFMENQPAGTFFGTLSAIDPENNPLTFNLIDGGGVFEIQSLNQLHSTLPLDYEAMVPKLVFITASVSDGVNPPVSRNFSILITNENETPSSLFTMGFISVLEDASVGTEFGTLATTDPDGDLLIYSLDENAAGAVSIDPVTGVLSVANSNLIDYENQSSIFISVRATDPGGLFATQDRVVIVQNVEEPPTSLTGGPFSVYEDAGPHTAIGAVSSSDPDMGVMIYSLDNDGGGRFAINASTGMLSVPDSSLLNYEMIPTHGVTVRATDLGGLFAIQNYTISVLNADDAPVGTSIASTFGNDQEEILNLIYSDEDGDMAETCRVQLPININISTPCNCLVGSCQVGVTATAGYVGPASLEFFVTANGLESQNSALATLTVEDSIVILSTPVHDFALGADHTCVILKANNGVKCWGQNDYSQLGIEYSAGLDSRLGDDPGEMAALPYVDLGTGFVAEKIQAGPRHTCVAGRIGSTPEVKCWGYNDFSPSYDYLGYGTPGQARPSFIPFLEMGDGLPVISQLSGIEIIQLSLSNHASCALTDQSGDNIWCWGRSSYGLLGTGTGQGSSVPYRLNMGGVRFTQMSLGTHSACAVSEAGKAKCWGYSKAIGLELGEDVHFSSNLGDPTRWVDLGSPDYIVEQVWTSGGSNYNACALITDPTTLQYGLPYRGIKCWGRYYATPWTVTHLPQIVGESNASAMGTNLPFINFAYGDSTPTAPFGPDLVGDLRIKKIVDTGAHNGLCAIFENNRLKCWGAGGVGLGTGSTQTIVNPPRPGNDSLIPFVNLHFAQAMEAKMGDGHTCAKLGNDTLRCWGMNQDGQLGLGHSNTIGTSPAHMGRNLISPQFDI